MTKLERNYSPMEKVCIKFLCYKMAALPSGSLRLISKADPIKYILKQPVLTGRLEK